MDEKEERVLRSLHDNVIESIDKLCKKGDISPTETKTVLDGLCVLDKIKNIQNEGSEYMNSGSPNRSYSNRHMNMGRGYSGHSINDRMIEKLEELHNNPNASEYENAVISEWVNRIRFGM